MNMKRSWIIIIVIVLLVIISFFSYNNLVQLQENVTKQWANVESVYQRRADLIPNLVSTVKGYANFEKSTLTQVVEARAKATSVNIDPSKLTQESLQQFQQNQEALGSALSRLMVVVERYPDLKANQNFQDLQSQLEGTENRIAVARRNYNEAVNDYNAKLKKFPVFIYAKMLNFDRKAYFQADKGTEKAPKVEF